MTKKQQNLIKSFCEEILEIKDLPSQKTFNKVTFTHFNKQGEVVQFLNILRDRRNKRFKIQRVYRG